MGKKKKEKRGDSSDGVEASEVVQPYTAEAAKEPRKSKRKKKEELEDDYDEDLSTLASEMGLGSAAAGKGVSDSPEGCPDPATSSIQPKASPAVPEAPTLDSHSSDLQSKSTSTKASKKKKKKATQQSEEETTVGEGGASVCGSEPPTSVKEPEEKREMVTSVTAVEQGNDITAAEDDEDKKKKKKKKKKPEEEKKSKGPSKGALSKIKKMQAALEEEKKRREQEALIAQREEEERERAREEKERLERERKERQKQKEKEKRERRKKEGKPVTKKEREAEARRLAQLAVLQEQGHAVPEKGVAEKKKVVYGSRQRTKKEQIVFSPAMRDSMDDDSVDGGSMVASSVERQRQNQVKEGSDEQEGLESWECWEDIEEANEVVVEHQAMETKRDKVCESVGSSTSDPATKKEGPGSEYSSDDDASSTSGSSSSDDDEELGEGLSPFAKAKMRIQNRRERYASERSADTLRSPVVCVLGHVDTGKTKLLDKIRRTNVQDGEAGGITQQIGATFVPVEAISEQTKMLKEFSKKELSLPGLLIIDTPGHESFRNLRTRGSSMCDLAILVVDIMHGLEPQTLESLSLLRKGNTPFIVALNKIDRLFDWHRNPNAGIRDTLKRQKPNTKTELEERVQQVTTEFAEQGLNVALFWEKVDFSEYVPLVPTSAITGDGMGDLIALLVEYSMKNLVERLMLSMELEAMVMEVKVLAGLGTTVDIILRNGILKEGDVLVLMGSEGPFVVTVRALLMPQPLKELRVKNAYISHSAVMAAQGVKMTAKGELEKALPGTPVLVAKKQDEVDVLKEEATSAMSSVLNSIKMQERGVYVQASTLGSLEALLEFLTQSKIPYSGISIGPVHKKDVMKASVMLEHDPQWAVILAFDIRVERDAQEMADSLNVKIFSADIIYHLFDSFLKHREELRERNRQQYQSVAVFPCKLRVLPNCIFNSRDPIVVGVVVEAGIIKPGTPLTVPSRNFTDIGVVASLEVNHKPVDSCRKGVEVCVKIEAVGGEAPRLYGRHFDHTDLLVSKISRESIDAVKNYFREDLQKADWQLMIELKKTFEIM